MILSPISSLVMKPETNSKEDQTEMQNYTNEKTTRNKKRERKHEWHVNVLDIWFPNK